MLGYVEMPQYAEIVTLDLKVRDVLLLRNILKEICCGSHQMLEVEFDTLLGFDKKYVANLCDFLTEEMAKNNI